MPQFFMHNKVLTRVHFIKLSNFAFMWYDRFPLEMGIEEVWGLIVFDYRRNIRDARGNKIMGGKIVIECLLLIFVSILFSILKKNGRQSSLKQYKKSSK